MGEQSSEEQIDRSFYERMEQIAISGLDIPVVLSPEGRRRDFYTEDIPGDMEGVLLGHATYTPETGFTARDPRRKRLVDAFVDNARQICGEMMGIRVGIDEPSMVGDHGMVLIETQYGEDRSRRWFLPLYVSKTGLYGLYLIETGAIRVCSYDYLDRDQELRIVAVR